MAPELTWGERTYVMGIVNVTPDSFSGDGLAMPDRAIDEVVAAAVALATSFVDAGAEIVDVGAESTRPRDAYGDRPAIDAEAEAALAIPVVRAIIAGTQPAKPTSMFEFASPSMMSFPLCAVIFLISIPCCSKKPFLIPRSRGSVLAIGSTPTVRLTVVACDFPGAPVAPPANRAATRRIAQPATSARLRCLAPVVFIPSPS